MMSKETRRVPKLRFPGFTEDWEQRKLIDIAKTFIGLVTTMTENYRDSGTLLIRNSDIKEGQFVFSENPIHLDEEFAEKNKTRRLQIGDVVTVHTGDIGTSAVIEEKEAGAIGFATINTRTDKSTLNPYFLATYFNTEKHKCYANSVSTGDGRSNYNIKDFNKLVISIPTLDEQERISVLINDINTIITLHQRKLDHLNMKKKALLQKLFPKNGERYPELRFSGFTDAWEQRKFDEIYERSGRKNDLTYGIDKIISVANMYFKTDAIVGSEKYLKTYNVFKLGDIAFEGHTNKEYSYGRFVENTIGDGIISHIFDVFTPKINLDINFWKDLIKYEPIMGPILRRCTKASRMMSNLTSKEFLEEKILCPTLEEQKLIGGFIVRLDKNITLHQRKLEHLQLQKKALLQQMFV
ncbi:restriction endonuclease subunit S [Veillonella parvula]|uniref:restriction endonuclease subunit S n=1 Tax=Veillonella parvula TaxID=29466 RepID=UPI000E693975|nr:restriction endonuclease subunit S [Veillonella parvula]RIW09118.1 restriction endonuclease subunit S [Veillonella parvula]